MLHVTKQGPNPLPTLSWSPATPQLPSRQPTMAWVLAQHGFDDVSHMHTHSITAPPSPSHSAHCPASSVGWKKFHRQRDSTAQRRCTSDTATYFTTNQHTHSTEVVPLVSPKVTPVESSDIRSTYIRSTYVARPSNIFHLYVLSCNP